MKTKMIPSLSMLVFNDINKPHRKFHLHYVICSVPQVARIPSDMERGAKREKGGMYARVTCCECISNDMQNPKA